MLTGAPADAAGGEDEDGWHGDARGEERRCAGALQRPQRFPLQTGQIQNSGKTELKLFCSTMKMPVKLEKQHFMKYFTHSAFVLNFMFFFSVSE